ncbi:MAG: efflux RND transporter periplasmic adaptor subunit [Burkholderiales bacterium]
MDKTPRQAGPSTLRTARAWTVHAAQLLTALATAATLAACQRGSDVATVPTIAPPTVNGQVITFAAASPQLKVLRSAEVTALTETTLELPGRVAWDETRTSRLLAPVGGRIVSLDVQPGQAVQAGQVLARLSAPDYGQAQADAAKAAADAQQARQTLSRATELLAAGAIAQRDLEAAQADAARSQAEQLRAQARLAGYGGGVSVDQRFALRSPVRGIVVERNATLNQEFRPDQGGPGTPTLFTVTDPTRVWIWFDVPEGQAARVRLGQTLDVRVDGTDPGAAPRSARIEQVADALDPATRSLRVRVALANADRSLKAEMFVRGLLHLPAATPQPLIDADAAVLIRGQRYVFVQTSEGRYERRPVRVFEAGPGRLQVLEGLRVGERVVTQGALLLQQVIGSAEKESGA